MPLKPKKAKSKNLPEMLCPECGQDMSADAEAHRPWHPKRQHALKHCNGSKRAFGAKDIPPHHTYHKWPDCWRCGEPLGCVKCAAGHENEVLCTACVVWGTKAALVWHGVITNDPGQLWKRGGVRAPQIADYPATWRSEYQRTQGAV